MRIPTSDAIATRPAPAAMKGLGLVRWRRPGLLLRMAVLLLTGVGVGSAHAFGACKISDAPLDIPEGPDAWVGAFRSAHASVPRTVVTVATKLPHAASATAPAVESTPPQRQRDWKAGRPPATDDRSRLAYAIRDDEVEQVRRYVRSPGMDLNAPISAVSRLSWIDLAAQFGDPRIVQLLIEGGARVRAAPGQAVDVHPVASAVYALASYVVSRDRPEPFFNRPSRSTERYAAAIRALLGAGADPNDGLDANGSPSLLVQLVQFTPRFGGDVELVRLLVEHGAVAGAIGSWPAPLASAIDLGYADYVDALLDARPGPAVLNDGLVVAWRRGDPDVAERLLARGADPDTLVGSTPLLCAAVRRAEPPSMALMLLAHGASPNPACGSRSDGPATPLTLVGKEDHELIDRLIERGAQLQVPAHDRDAYESEGVRAGPVVWALLHDRDYLAARMIARDPRLAQDECGAVVYASRFGASLTLAELLRHGADPNATSERGVSALMAAAFYDQTAALVVLLAQPRIDIEQKTPVRLNPGFFGIHLEGSQPPLTSGGRTALAYAKLAGARSAMALLAAHGAR